MPYNIQLTPDAQEHLARFTARQRSLVLDEIERQLLHQPAQETRKRKRLRPNPLVSWELRVGNLRVFYDVNEDTYWVEILAVGKKAHNRLIIGDKEFYL